jgi:hypothetical protein
MLITKGMQGATQVTSLHIKSFETFVSLTLLFAKRVEQMMLSRHSRGKDRFTKHALIGHSKRMHK